MGYLDNGDDGLEALRLDETDAAHQARAYEAASAAQLARLKTAVAFQFHWHGEAPLEARRSERGTRGFAHEAAECPVPWALAVLDPAHSAPARLLAALLPAVLAGVRRILILCPALPSPANCVALEIAGLEDVFVTPDTMPLALLRKLAAEGQGRLLLFPAREHPLWPALEAAAREARIPCRTDAPPRLYVGSADDERRELIRWAQGGALWLDAPTGCDAAFADADAPLTLGPGLEACWLAHDCGRDFFRSSRVTANLAPTSPEEAL